MPHTRYYLELPPGHEVAVVGRFPDGHVLRREILPEVSLCRQLYEEVGRDYQWTDRLGWSDERWTYHFMKPQVQLWVLWAITNPAGYFELRREDDDESVEIAYFGLRPEYTGRGLGGRLLACAVRQAREVAPRVWVHTCTKDHPHALANYRSRGFQVFRTESIE
jgi:ribosomal protein S18 acetylase RimI-like enzyme